MQVDWKVRRQQVLDRGVVFAACGSDWSRITIPDCVRWVADGIVDIPAIVSHRLPLSEVAHGLDLCNTGRDETLKVVLDINI